MKALVISKPKEHTKEAVTPERLRESKENLQVYIDKGIVEHVYAIIGGGSAYVVNVETKEELEKGIEENNLTQYANVEVIIIEEKIPTH